MKHNIFAKKRRNIIRCTILFTTLIISNISYSCLKKDDVPPVYSEIPDANFRTYLKTIVPLAFTPDDKFISNHPSVVSYNELMSISRKNITSLSGIEYFISLTELDCNDNQLTKLDVSRNKALTKLDCGYNQLNTLDVSKNLNLIRLECYRNQLTSLDISENTNLIWLNCYINRLHNLDVSKNQALKRIYCSSNQLTTLDVSKNLNLTTLECYSNRLTTLVISKDANSLWLYIDNSIKCCDPSIKAFKDRGGNLFDYYYQEIAPFVCE